MNNQTRAKQAKLARILDFCRGGKTSEEISEHLGIPESTLGNFRAELLLARQIYKVIPEVVYFNGMGPTPCYFVTTGTECNRPPPNVLPKDAPDPKINHDFIKVAHRCLHLGES